MQSAIPLTEYNRIVQTKLSPKTIAALLNEAESTYSSKPLHWNAKRRYPFWKVCQNCQRIFPCETREQAARNKTCSQECANTLIGKANEGDRATHSGRVWLTCPVCGKRFWRFRNYAQRANLPVCSRQCNGILRGKEWKLHAHKGRAAWSQESEAALVERMTGNTNPAWKGGVTYFRKHGNYAPIKYVRCPREFLPMARKDGYVMEHRLLVAQHLGRCLKRSEVVHHIDHDPTNNDPANLMLFSSNTAHKRYEGQGQPAPLWQL